MARAGRCLQGRSLPRTCCCHDGRSGQRGSRARIAAAGAQGIGIYTGRSGYFQTVSVTCSHSRAWGRPQLSSGINPGPSLCPWSILRGSSARPMDLAAVADVGFADQSSRKHLLGEPGREREGAGGEGEVGGGRGKRRHVGGVTATGTGRKRITRHPPHISPQSEVVGDMCSAGSHAVLCTLGG